MLERRPSAAGTTAVLLGAAVLGLLDAATAVHPLLSPALTFVESVLFLPWARAAVFVPGREIERGRGLVGAHAVTIGVVLLCLVTKWFVLAGAHGADDAYAAPYRIYTLFATVVAVAALFARGRRLGRILLSLADHPARLMVLSFGGMAVFGALLLSLPMSLRDLERANFIDALFMATSAICVTGLTVHDVATTYTPFGQLVLLLMIQAGGLGIMVLSTFFFFLAGGRLGVRSSAVLAESLDAGDLASLRRTVLTIVLMTIGFEALGALALYGAFAAYPEIAQAPAPGVVLSGPGSRLWAAVFHSVSAFCNAGFSLFPLGFAPFVSDVPVNLTIMMLIVIGGLGFPVLDELFRSIACRLRGQRPSRLSLHSRTVLAASLLLVLGLAVLLAPLEWSRAFGPLSWPHKLMAALFQAVTTRTAGFNTVDVGLMHPASWMIIGALMFVGASPGSTGGGIKTSTLAALFATVRSVLRGEPKPRLFDRTLPAGVHTRALGVVVLSGLLLSVFTFMALLTEDFAPPRVVFEVVSAFATVGLSTGITGELSPAGRLLLCVTMLAGRVGPLTLALALAQRAHRSPAVPVEERVLIG